MENNKFIEKKTKLNINNLKDNSHSNINKYIPLESFIDFLQGSIDRVNEEESGLMVKELDLAFNCYFATIDKDPTDGINEHNSLAIHIPDPAKSFDVNFNSTLLGNMKIKFSVLPNKKTMRAIKMNKTNYNAEENKNNEKSANNINDTIKNYVDDIETIKSNVIANEDIYSDELNINSTGNHYNTVLSKHLTKD